MWVLVFISVVILGYLIFRRSVDRTTLRNVSYLFKLLGVLVGILLVFTLIFYLTHK
jgi:hypothetical protein